jgi:AraC family transcriptional regulator
MAGKKIMKALLPALLLTLFVSAISLVSFLLVRNGAFMDVEITTKDLGPFVFLAKNHVGPYHQIATVLNEIEDWTKKNNVDCSETFGEYLDDPGVVEHARLQSYVGCVLSGEISTSPSTLEQNKFLTRRRPLQKYIVALFKGSPALGPYKVYGKVEEFRQKNNLTAKGPPIEIYKSNSPNEHLTTYLFPVK